MPDSTQLYTSINSDEACDDPASNSTSLGNALATVPEASASEGSLPPKDGIGEMRFDDLVSEETKAAFRAAGREAELTPAPLPSFLIGIDDPIVGGVALEPTLDQIGAVSDLKLRAVALFANGVWATSDLARDLIMSVADAGVLGPILQNRLEPEPKPRPPLLPPIKLKRKRLRRVIGGDLFEAFDISVDSK